MASSFNARDAAVYERSMGRWSRRLAPGLLRFASVGSASRVLDVGCGTGSLVAELAALGGHDDIQGIDASEIYVAAASARFEADQRIKIETGDAEALPFEADTFDAALSQLVLQFVGNPAAALTEMCRVVRPGGVVAASVWNSGGGMPHQRMFWDTAAMLDPEAARLRGKTFTRPMTRRHDLQLAFQAAGLEQVTEDAVTIWMEFADFDDFWAPIASGEGTLGKYVGALDAGGAERLADALRTAFESGAPDGPRAFACTAAVCRGIVPG